MNHTYLLAAIGSAGDVHPVVGLGSTLRQRGHRVVILTSGYFRPTIENADLECIETISRDEYLQMLHHPDLWHPKRGTELVLRTTIEQLTRRLYDLLADVYQPGRTTLAATSLGFGARLFAEKHNAPLAMIHLQPSIMRSKNDPPVLPMADLRWMPRWLVPGMWRLIDLLLKPLVDRPLNKVRAELGLPPIHRAMHHWLHAPDMNLACWPDWYAPQQPDWPGTTHLVGFPLWDAGDAHDALPDHVESFLQTGPPPVIFTPGSAMAQAHTQIAHMIEATQRLDQRLILLTPFADQVPPSLPNHVAHFDYVPLANLLPRCAAMVHHGGMGTMGQCFAAGVPQLLMPMAHDQFDNAARVRTLGVGQSLSRSRFTAQRLTPLLHQLLNDPYITTQCKTFQHRIADAGPSLPRAADYLERLAKRT